MREVLLNLAGSVIGGVATGIFLCIPMFALMWWVFHRKKRYKAEREDPFTDLPLRPAGESLRLRIDDLADEQMSTVLIALITPVFALLFITILPPQYRLHGVGAAFIVISTVSFLVGRDVTKGFRNLWNHKLAFTGERVVGEELNQLLADGCHVFHDLPFENFNIDHVIVGPSGVYAVETKTRRKPKENGKKAGHKVEFDGTSLTFEKIESLTRDIDLADAILDLLDNCVDGARRLGLKGGERPYEGKSAKITYTGTEFTIEDNCGGISLKDAKENAFRFGRTAKHAARAEGWTKSRAISMPELTVKERIHINQLLPECAGDPHKVHKSLGFHLEELEHLSLEKIRNYTEFYRHFPQFGRIAI